jgi:hypothetical protein
MKNRKTENVKAILKNMYQLFYEGFDGGHFGCMQMRGSYRNKKIFHWIN